MIALQSFGMIALPSVTPPTPAACLILRAETARRVGQFAVVAGAARSARVVAWANLFGWVGWMFVSMSVRQKNKTTRNNQTNKTDGRFKGRDSNTVLSETELSPRQLNSKYNSQ